MDYNGLALPETTCYVCFWLPMVLFMSLEMLLRSCLAGVRIFNGQKSIHKAPAFLCITFNTSIVWENVFLSLACLYCSFSIWLFLILFNAFCFECLTCNYYIKRLRKYGGCQYVMSCLDRQFLTIVWWWLVKNLSNCNFPKTVQRFPLNLS